MCRVVRRRQGEIHLFAVLCGEEGGEGSPTHLKVPLDASESEEARLAALEEGVHRVGVVTVDVDLLHDREADAVVLLLNIKRMSTHTHTPPHTHTHTGK